MTSALRIALPVLMLGLASQAVARDAWIWNQSDWSEGRYESAEALDAEIEPGELVLVNDPNRLVYAFDASDRAGVWGLCRWRDRLYLAACQDPANVNGGDILVYDDGADSVLFDYAVFEQGICVLETHDDAIFSPGIDSMGSWAFGNIYYNAGQGWIRKETVPAGVHVFDIAFLGGRIWVTTGSGLAGYPGVLYSSDDMGETWIEEFRVEALPPDTYRRLLGCHAWNGSLFVQGDGRAPEGPVIYEFAGGDPILHEIPWLDPGILAGFASFDDRLFCLARGTIHFYDGELWQSLDLPIWSNGLCRALCVYDERLYAGGEAQLLVSADGEDWTQLGVSVLAGREIEALAQHHGRLYAGTLGDAAVFVTPAAPEGILVSEPHSFPGFVTDGVLNWQGIAPSDQTRIEFQLRSSALPNDLPARPFLGPDGSDGTWYTAPGEAIAAVHHGDRHFQYRVRLVSELERLAPVLTEFSLEAEGETTAAAGGSFVLGPGLAVWPNPFLSELRIRLPSGARAAGEDAVLSVFDIRGRIVREIAPSSAGSRAIWDGRDQAGSPVSAGVYMIRWLDGDRRECKRVLKLR